MWTDTGYNDGFYRASRITPQSFTCSLPRAVWLPPPPPVALLRWGNPKHKSPMGGRGQLECLVLGRDQGQWESRAPDGKGSSAQLSSEDGCQVEIGSQCYQSFSSVFLYRSLKSQFLYKISQVKNIGSV